MSPPRHLASLFAFLLAVTGIGFWVKLVKVGLRHGPFLMMIRRSGIRSWTFRSRQGNGGIVGNISHTYRLSRFAALSAGMNAR